MQRTRVCGRAAVFRCARVGRGYAGVRVAEEDNSKNVKQKQIPCGNDNKKSNGKSKGKRKGKRKRKGNCNNKSDCN